MFNSVCPFRQGFPDGIIGNNEVAKEGWNDEKTVASFFELPSINSSHSSLMPLICIARTMSVRALKRNEELMRGLSVIPNQFGS